LLQADAMRTAPSHGKRAKPARCAALDNVALSIVVSVATWSVGARQRSSSMLTGRGLDAIEPFAAELSCPHVG